MKNSRFNPFADDFLKRITKKSKTVKRTRVTEPTIKIFNQIKDDLFKWQI